MNGIGPIVTAVDLGSGNQNLEAFCILNNIDYYPYDKVERFTNTNQIDFNKKEYPLLPFDLSIALGICEYLNCLTWFINKLEKYTDKYILISYTGKELISNMKDRVRWGFKNHITTKKFISLFKKFNVIKYKKHYGQTIFLLKRKKT